MKRFRLAFLVTLISVLTLAVFGELYLRATTSRWTLNDTLKYDRAIFSRHIIRPERQTIKRYSNPEQQIQINRHGFRGDGFKRTKPEGQTRVLVYGGSQVFDHTGGPPGWPDRAEKLLQERGHSNVEIINAGVPGHASFDSLGKLFSNDHYLDPDIVILNNAWNDFKYFHYEKSPLRNIRVHRVNNNPRRYYQNGLDRLLGESSQVYTVLRQYFLQYVYNPGGEGLVEEVENKRSPTSEALKQYRLTVETFVDTAENIKALPILMTQPRLITHDMSEATKQRIAYHYLGLTPDGLREAYQASDRILAEVSDQTDARLWKAADDIARTRKNFVDHVHFTHHGADKMARELSTYLSDYLRDR